MDISILLVIQEFRNATNGIFSTFFAKMTLLGEGYLSYLLIFAMYWCVDRKFGRRLVLGSGFARAANGIAKLTVCAYRPWIRSDLIEPADGAKTTATGYSFPSGHSTSATMSLGHIGWHYRKDSRPFAWVMYFTVALVMFSRLFLGVHTPQDVLVGCGLTVLMLILSNKILDWMEAGTNRDLIVLVGVIVITVLGILYILFKSYPMDYDEAGKLIVNPISMQPDSFGGFGVLLGALCGIILEDRLVRFSTDVPFEQKLLRFAVGALLYTFVNATGKPVFALIFTSKNVAYMARYFVNMFLFAGIYPMMFQAWERPSKK